MTNADTGILVAALINAPRGASGGSVSQAAAMAAEVEAWLTTGTQTALGAVTFTDAGDLVGLVAHGLVAGDVVIFPTVVTTTGLTQGTTEYTVRTAGLTADAFTVSSTGGAGGSAVTLTTNGTGTVTKRTASSADANLAVLTAAQAYTGRARSVREVTTYADVIAAALTAG